MKKYLLALVTAVCAGTASTALAQSIYEPYSFTTLAGLALNSGSTDDTGNLARFTQPWGLAVDGAENVFVADTLNHTIRKMTPAGVVTTLAGVAGSAGFADGPASTAQFSRPLGVAVNSAGTVVYVADRNNHLIRRISGGVVTTLAGSLGVIGSADGTGTNAQFHYPNSVAVDSSDNVYVADGFNYTIRKIAPGGSVTTLAGSPGVYGSTDAANNRDARFGSLVGIAVDNNGNIYVGDLYNFTVRKILSYGGVSTLAGLAGSSGFIDGLGSAARFSNPTLSSPGGPTGVAVDNHGNVYVSDQGNHVIRKITPGGSVTTLGGTALTAGGDDGTGSTARFNFPAGVAVDGAGNVFVADTYNHIIRLGVNTNAGTCPNLVVNGSFEFTSPAVLVNTFNNSLDATTGVPGWTTDPTNYLEVWGNNTGFPASLGTNQLEINAQSADETVWQVVTGLSTNCPATFSFDYAGRFGVVGGTPNNDFTVTISSGGSVISVPLDPPAAAIGGWLSYYTNFVPTASTVTIAFRGRPHFSDGTVATQGGAHIDNVSLIQCCDTNTSVCPNEVPLDANGNMIVPVGLDTNLLSYVEVNHLLGSVEQLNPGFDTSVDLWYTNLTCLQSIGGTVPTNAASPDFTNLLAGIGITNVSPEEIVLTYSNWNVLIASQAVSETLSFPTAGPVGPSYFPPAKPHCPDPTKKYAFGGRDIVFVHGLKLDHVFAKIAGNQHASQNWITPTQFPGSTENPEFYGNGYFKGIAEATWADHIQKFLTANGYQNRYLIVDYPCTERLEIGAQAVLTQISDAMHFGTGVKDLDASRNPDTSNFGTPSFVVVSHSTGTILTDVAMTAASQYPNLGAGYIPKMCKAHVAMDGVFSGSEEATAAIVVSGFASIAIPSWACAMSKETIALFDPSLPTFDCYFASAFASSVLVDLVPLVSQYKWGSFVDQTPVRTIMLVGGHPSYLAPIKNLIMPGFDDGVTTINSQVANPNSRFLWPSGFRPAGLNLIGPFDMGLAGTGNGQQSGLMSPIRAIQYYIDQVAEPLRLLPAPLLIAGGATPYLSPSGMRQDVGDAFNNTHFSTLNRYHNHFSFIQSASDHLVGYTHVDTYVLDHDYHATFGEENQEESRVITDPAVYDLYSMVYPGDDAPLLDRSCVPKVETWERGRKIEAIHFAPFGRFGPSFTWGPWWIWRRVYDLLQGWETKMGCDYMYESVLHCPPLKTCSACIAPPVGLALWLPFDEAAGSTAYNFFSGGSDGSLYNGSLAATSTNGPVHVVSTPGHASPIDSFNGGSLYFDGLDDNVVVPSYNGINVGTGDFTLGAWVKRDPNSGAASTRVIIDKRDPATDIGYSFVVTSGILRFQMTSTAFNVVNFQDSATVPADNLWHFTAVTVSRGPTNSVCQFYVDGTPTATVSQNTPLGSLTNSTPLRVGSSLVAGADPWMGGIDEVLVFSRALTISEMPGIFNAGSAGLCKPACATPLVVNCTTNKVVDCGSAWKFDLPTATGISATIAPTSLVTSNKGCMEYITQTWLITDACGNRATCSQTVTVVDTQPPTITCQTNRLIVALNANCQLEIPTIRPPASDNCTPASQLVYTQIPPAGTILPRPCHDIVVTVTDACGNSNKCVMTVCGQDQTPPTLSYPKAVTVTNCLVPNVLALVSASDNCTPAEKLVLTQSPPAGTPIAAGGNLVTVTVTDQAGNITTCVIPLTSSGAQSFLDVMFNTGVDNHKGVLSYGSIDPHYTLGPVPIGTPTGPGFYNAPAATVFNLWGLPPFTLSRWIYPGNDWTSYPDGNYTHTNSFVLPAGGNPLTASISGRWAADAGAIMYLNGLAPANQVSAVPSISFAPPTSPAGYSHWTYFTVNTGFLASPAINKLYLVVTNAYAYDQYPGLRVEFTDATINCGTCTPPVITLKMRNQSLPLNSTAVFYVNVSGTPPLTLQWYHNGLPLANGGHYAGVNTPTLTITPLSYADAGTYSVIISNPCGEIHSNPAKLTVTKGWPWWWAWWNFAQIGKPLVATVGPDLMINGTNHLGISSGTTRDFDLPNIGGQIANVMYVPPLPRGTSIQLPYFGPPGSNSVNSFTIIMDLCEPDTSSGTTSTLFESVRIGLLSTNDPGQASVSLTLDAQNKLHLTGSAAGLPFDDVSAAPLPVDVWNRLALVIDDPHDGIGANLSLYLNGQSIAGLTVPTPAGSEGIAVSWLNSNSLPTLLSRQTNDLALNGEFYLAGIQFHTVAFAPQMVASIGSPDTGPMPPNDTSVGAQPVLSITISNGIVNLPWMGSAFLLQETLDLTGGVWVDSVLPFDQVEVNGDILTTSHARPPLTGPTRFYRLYMP